MCIVTEYFWNHMEDLNFSLIHKLDINSRSISTIATSKDFDLLTTLNDPHLITCNKGFMLFDCDENYDHDYPEINLMVQNVHTNYRKNINTKLMVEPENSNDQLLWLYENMWVSTVLKTHYKIILPLITFKNNLISKIAVFFYSEENSWSQASQYEFNDETLNFHWQYENDDNFTWLVSNCIVEKTMFLILPYQQSYSRMIEASQLEFKLLKYDIASRKVDHVFCM